MLLYSDKATYTFLPFVSDKKRLFGFFEEKGRAATPASFSHYKTILFS
jgi:lysine/ornithine N-monooxygenase